MPLFIIYITHKTMKRYIDSSTIYTLELSSGQTITGVQGGHREQYEKEDGWNIYQFRSGIDETVWASIAKGVGCDYTGDFLTQETIVFPDAMNEIDIVSVR